MKVVFHYFKHFRFLSQPDLGSQFDKETDNIPRSYSNRETDKLDIDLAQFEYPAAKNDRSNKRMGKYGNKGGKRRDGLRSSALSGLYYKIAKFLR